MLGYKKNKNVQQKKTNKNIEIINKKNKKIKNSPPNNKLKTSPEQKKYKKEDSHFDKLKNNITDAYKSKEKEQKHNTALKKQTSQHHNQTHTANPSKMLRTSPIAFHTSKSKDRSVSIKANTNRSHYNQKEKEGIKNVNRQLFKQNKENLISKSNQKSKEKSKEKARSKSRLKTDRDISPLKYIKALKQFNVADRQIKAQELKKAVKKKMQKDKPKEQAFAYPIDQVVVQIVKQQQRMKLRKKVPQIKTEFSQRRGSYFDENLLKKLQINKNQQKTVQLCPFTHIKSNFEGNKSPPPHNMSARSYIRFQPNDVNASRSHERLSEVQVFKKQQEIKWKIMLEQLNNLKHEPHIAEKIDSLIEQLNRNYNSLQDKALQLSSHSNHSKNSKPSQSKAEHLQKDDNQNIQEQSSISLQFQSKFKKRTSIQSDDHYHGLYFPKITKNPNNGQENQKNKSNQSSIKSIEILKASGSKLIQAFKKSQQSIQIYHHHSIIQPEPQHQAPKCEEKKALQDQKDEVDDKQMSQLRREDAGSYKYSLEIATKGLIQQNNEQINSPVMIHIQDDQKQFKRSNNIILSDFYNNFIDKKPYDLKAQFNSFLKLKEVESEGIPQASIEFDPHKESDKILLQELNVNGQSNSSQTHNEFIRELQGNQIGQLFFEEEIANFHNEVRINAEESSQSLLLNVTHNDNIRNQQIVSQIQHTLIIEFCTNILRSRSILHNFLVTYSEMVDNNAINVDLPEEHVPAKLNQITNSHIVTLVGRLINHIQINYQQEFMKQIQMSYICKPIEILRFMRATEDQEFYDKSSIFESEEEPQVPYFSIQKIEEFETEVLKNQFFIPNYFSFNHCVYDCFNDIFQDMRPYGGRGKAMFSLELSMPYTNFKEVKNVMIKKFGQNIEEKYYDEKLNDDFCKSHQQGIFEMIYFVCLQINEQIFQSESEKIGSVLGRRLSF